MRTLYHRNTLAIMMSALLTVCGKTDSRAADASKFPPQSASTNAAQSVESRSLADIIDDLAGHPDDPQLPKAALGASDSVLMATDSREIAALLKAGREFAEKQSETPRFLFALGRAAMFHGYDRLGHDLLKKAAGKGSAAATAYLGYQAEASGEAQEAIKLLKSAIERGFKPALAEETLASLIAQQNEPPAKTGKFDPSKFNRPDLIGALHRSDVAALKSDQMNSLIYAATLHDVLWSDSVLFLADDPVILLELDPAVTVNAGMQMATSSQMVEQAAGQTLGALFEGLSAMANARQKGATIGQEVAAMNRGAMEKPAKLELLKNQATQDGRRLAMLYSTAPDDFRRVYNGIKALVGASKTAANNTGHTGGTASMASPSVPTQNLRASGRTPDGDRALVASPSVPTQNLAATSPVPLYKDKKSGNWIHGLMESDVGPISSAAPRNRAVIQDQIKKLQAGGQKIIDCIYGPIEPEDNRGFVTYHFWYQNAPENLEQLVAIDPNHPFRSLGKFPCDDCPEDKDKADTLRNASRSALGTSGVDLNTGRPASPGRRRTQQ